MALRHCRWSGRTRSGHAATLALGTVTVNFAPREGGIQGRIENHGGDARIDGEMTLGSEGIERRRDAGATAFDAARSHARFGRTGYARRQRRRASAVAQRAIADVSRRAAHRREQRGNPPPTSASPGRVRRSRSGA